MIEIETIKMLTDETNETKIKYLINAVTKKILGYCNISELPIELEDVVIQIIIDRIDREGPILTELAAFKFQPINKPIDELEPHKSLLNRFRKVSRI